MTSILLIFVALASLTSCAQDAKDTRVANRSSAPSWIAYVEETIDWIEENSIKRDSVDWADVRSEAMKRMQQKPGRAEAHSTIRYVLQRLGDRHSFLSAPDELKSRSQAKGARNDPPSGTLLPHRIGYLSVTGTRLGDSRFGSYADTLHDEIQDLDSAGACGWIVDLRSNTGGNMWPMLLGLGPLLGEGDLFAMVPADQEFWWVSYRDGKMFSLGGEVTGSDADERAYPGSKEDFRLHRPPYRLRSAQPPVAVLIGNRTSSSGEWVLVAFLGREGTRTFGAPSYGVPTGNASNHLSDGAVLWLTTTISQDRQGRRYSQSIVPDQQVGADPRAQASSKDEVAAAASEWLLTQKPCISP